MKLLYLWISKSENGFIQNQGFNISGKYFWEFNEETRTLTAREKDGYIEDFWNNDSIEDISVIVGTNASGKSTLMSELTECDFIIPHKPENNILFEDGERRKIVIYEQTDNIYYYHNLKNEIRIKTTIIQKLKKSHFINFTKIFVTNSKDNMEKATMFFNHNLSEDNIRKHAKKLLEPYNIPYNSLCMSEIDESNHHNDSDFSHIKELYYKRAIKLRNEIIIDTNAYQDLNTVINLYFFIESKCKNYFGKTFQYIAINFKKIEELCDEEKLIEKLETDIICKKIFELKRKEENYNFNRLTGCFLYEFMSYYGEENIFEVSEISIAQIKKIYNSLLRIISSKKENKTEKEITIEEYFLHATEDLILFYKLTKENTSSIIYLELESNQEFFDRVLFFFKKGIPSIFLRYLRFEFKGMSSGEEALLNLYSKIFWVYNTQCCEKESLIFIDEIDLYMHPKWQRGLISYLVEDIPSLIGKDNKAQIIVTTHSPIILSDIPKSNILFLENKDGKCVVSDNEKHRDTFGNNVHTLFLDSFFLSDEGTMGAFAEDKINKIIDILMNKEDVNDEDNSILNTIKIIGDELIRNKLLESYNQKVNHDVPIYRERSQKEIDAIDESIAALKEQISSMEKTIAKLEQLKR